MDHRDCVELLPWFAAGALDESERREVEQHLEDCASCRGELAQTRRAARLFAADHPPPERLLAYVHDGIDDDREWRALSAHLDRCGECREEVELCRQSRPPSAVLSGRRRPDGAGALPRSWLAVAALLLVMVAAAALFEARSAGRAGAEARRAGQELAAERQATAKARAESQARAGELAGLRSEVERLLEPGVAAVVELLPAGAQRGGAAPGPPRVAAAGSRFVTLLLGLEERRDFERYRIVVFDAAGGERWRLSDVEPRPDGALALALPTRELPVGRLRIEVAGQIEERPDHPVAVYELEVVPAQEGGG